MFLSSMENGSLMHWDPSEPKGSWKLPFSPPVLAFGMNSLMEELVSSLPLHPASQPFPPLHHFHVQGKT